MRARGEPAPSRPSNGDAPSHLPPDAAPNRCDDALTDPLLLGTLKQPGVALAAKRLHIDATTDAR